MKHARTSFVALLLAVAVPAGAKSAMPTPAIDWRGTDQIDITPGSLDLTRDPGFASGGSTFVDNPTSGGTNDRAVAIVEDGAGGYWLVGSSTADDGVHVTPVVTPFSAVGAAGTPMAYPEDTTLSGLSSIVAAVEGVNAGTRRIYVIGTYHSPGYPDADFGVICLDPAQSFHGCSSFGFNGVQSVAFDRGGSNDDTPRALAYDALSGDLYVTGTVDFGGYFAAGVVRLNGSTGARVSEWGNATTSNGTFVYPIQWTANGDAVPLAIVAGAPMLFEHDVFVVGFAFANSAHTDTDGFVLPIDAVNGTGFDPLWNGGNLKRIFFDLGATNKIDALSAVSLRHNGSLLIAGQAENDTEIHMILGEFDPVGAARADFCGGTGVCQGFLSNESTPSAVLERPGAGDIVVGATSVDPAGDDVQAVYEFGPHGTAIVAYDEVAWDSAQSTTPLAIANGLLIDDENRVLQAGYRLWNLSIADYDMTVARWRATDSIFGNGFGGAYAD